ncbi:MAG TPA: PTS sugar transporter subunit IIA [Candidatus Hydrogenedens sp.]|nr:PTS sugar transporter subunit IIA [Candidatus Hydrogenedens sp.]
MLIGLSKYITKQTVCVSRDTMPSVLERIFDLVSSANKRLNQLKSKIYNALSAREMLESTAITHGLDLSHCRIPYISDFILGIIAVPNGIACNASDRKANRVFVFTIAPQNSGNDYLKIMAELASFLDSDEKINKLAKAKDE